MEITQSNFESITTDFNDLKVKITINSQDIKKYLCAVVENNKKYYIVFSTTVYGTANNTFYGLFTGSTNSSIYILESKGLTTASGMFAGCSSLKTLNLSNFNTQNVCFFTNMFKNTKIMSVTANKFLHKKLFKMLTVTYRLHRNRDNRGVVKYIRG